MSIRFKLAIIATAVILVANSLLCFATLQYLGHVWLREVQTRVQRNLNSARAAYLKHGEVIAAFLDGAALDRAIPTALRQADLPQLQAILRDLHGAGKMDFVLLLDATGKVICRGKSPQAGDDLSGDPLVALALRNGKATTGTVIYSLTRLRVEGSELAERARMQVIPTPAARPTDDTFRTEAMVLSAAVPVRDAEGRMLGVLHGGNLVNRRYEIVDTIKQEVFPRETYRGKDIGTVTIFQGDMRIATNVTMDNGSRAVGTRMSASVSDVVLDRAGRWAGPAFVVNDWYITAYEPIQDPAGRVIGSLYVGLLRAPFAHQRNVIVGVVLAVVVAATAASLLLLVTANQLVLGPIRHVVAMAHRVIGGDLSARVGIRPPGEMGRLCWAIDSMAHAVAEREEMIKQTTRMQLNRTEQLASVGRLAAGVAHEINNPLVGVLTFADLMREKENMDPQDKEDLELIIRETKRVRDIVRGLLDFARETPSVKARLDLNELVRQTLRLLGRRDAFQNIYIVEDLEENLPLVHGDKSQLQQVLMNLALNACEAMAAGGTLLIATASADKQAVVNVTDTGCGIPKEHVGKIFEPFFTTKPTGKGTGLGLSVSYGIVQQHDGTLEVQSEVGRGTTFTVTLPSVQAVLDSQSKQSQTTYHASHGTLKTEH